MRIAIIGASGYIGSQLAAFLEKCGHEVLRISRSERPGWRVLGDSCLEGAEALINVAGEHIDQRWTEEKKAKLRQSRVDLTTQLARWITEMENPLRIWLNASAVGIYGDCGDTLLDESSPLGEGFLADLCSDWEAAAVAEPCRVAHLRFGIALGQGSMLHKRLNLLFSFGLGGRLGKGTQWLPWVHIDDICDAVQHILNTESLHGAINLTSPEPLTNAEFTHKLAKILHRPAFFHVPAFALHLGLGEFATALLASHRATPQKLLDSGYTFHHATFTGRSW